MRVRLAISIGDPTGIGPEIISASLMSPLPGVDVVVYGFTGVWRRIGLDPPTGSGVRWIEPELPEDVSFETLQAGRPDLTAGHLQLASLESAFEAVARGEADALCTAPITKVAARRAGFAFPGHTEYLASRTGIESYAMMLAGPGLRVVPLTTHLPLMEVSRQLTPASVSDGLLVTTRALVGDFGLTRPRLALAALNPHAGEEGMLGDEESEILRPGIEMARRALARQGIDAEIHGPLSADGLFIPPIPFDAVVCCYHDQAMIPLKLLHREEAVNITLGLPIVRTSPAHGTAAEIAWQGQASPRSMRTAMEKAAELARRRSQSSG